MVFNTTKNDMSRALSPEGRLLPGGARHRQENAAF